MSWWGHLGGNHGPNDFQISAKFSSTIFGKTYTSNVYYNSTGYHTKGTVDLTEYGDWISAPNDAPPPEAQLQAYEANMKVYGAEYMYEDIKEDISKDLYGNKKNATPSYSKSKGIGVTYNYTNQKQVFTSSAYAYTDGVSLNVTKQTDSNYTDIVENNPNYSLDGTTFYVYTDATYSKRVQDKDNKDIVITIDAQGKSNTVKLASTYANKTLYLKEVTAGKGYKLCGHYDAANKKFTAPYDGKYGAFTLGAANTTTTITVEDIPIADPPALQLQKKSNENNGNFTSNSAYANGAVYKVEFYASVEPSNPLSITGNANRTWTYTTSNINGLDGVIRFRDNPTSGTPFKDKQNENTWPLGWYKIYESTVPEYNGEQPGLLKSNIVYYAHVEQDHDHPDGTKTTYYAQEGRNISQVTTLVDSASGNELLTTIESEKWLPFGVTKVDKVKHDAATGVDYSNRIGQNNSQGNTKYENAIFLVTNSNQHLFDNYAGTHDGNGDRVNDTYTLSRTVPSTLTIDGKEYNITTSHIQNSVVFVNGEPLYIKTDKDGKGKTKYDSVWSDKYQLVEVYAPEGFVINTVPMDFNDDWLDEDGNVIVSTIATDKDGKVKVNLPGVVGLVGTNGHKAEFPNDVIRGSITITKKDANREDANDSTQAPTGDASLEGIRYAVVNVSAHSVIYPYPNGTEYEVNEIVDIITTNKDGFAQTKLLPFGSYTLHELRRDATIQVGAKYDETKDYGGVYGTSIYANDSYMFNDKQKFDTYKILEDGQIYNVESQLQTIEEAKTYENSFKNYTAKGSIEILKFNAETNTQKNQGINKLSGIRYAIVNESEETIYLDGVPYGKNKIVAILTTDETGYCRLDNLTYGTYRVHELRQDSTNNVGEEWVETGVSNKANDYYLYSDNISEKLINLNGKEPTYTVASQVDHIRTAGELKQYVYANAPIRGNYKLQKVDIDGYSMGYVPYLISHLDNEGNVIESHVIITDENGSLDTSLIPKSIDTVNKNDVYYVDGKLELGASNKEEAEAILSTLCNNNVWFGDTTELYKGEYVNSDRGSFLVGNYTITEIPCKFINDGDDMNSGTFTISEDREVVDAGKIMVDLPIQMYSEAWDVYSDSNSLTLGTEVEVKDSVEIHHLKVDREYKIVSNAYNIVEGKEPKLLGTKEHIIGYPTAIDEHKTTTLKEDLMFTIDSSECEPGSYVALEDILYSKVDGNWVEVKRHNETFDVDSQMIFVPNISTKAVNEVTNNRVGSLEPETRANDFISYENLGNKTNYLFTISFVDDNGNIIKDYEGNDCTITKQLYTDNRSQTVSVVNGMITGPTTATFSLTQIGVEPFVIANDDTLLNGHFVISVRDNMTNNEVLSHNGDLSDELEMISWIKIHTFAGSSNGYRGIIPLDTQAELTDIITYENVIEPVDVIIEGEVYVQIENVDENGESTYAIGELVATNTATKSLAIGSGTIDDFTFTFDSTPYADKKLVVFEKIYLTNDNGDKIALISEHCDASDNNQVVAVPNLETDLMNIHDGSGYKIVSQEVKDITLVDYVSYSNLIPGDEWKLTARLMDKKTGKPVLDADGNEVVKEHIFIPTKSSGIEPVEITFTKLVVSEEWENDESWVCFESVRPNTPGYDDRDYVVHNDLEDTRQEVYVPKFRTTAVNAENEWKQIAATTNQTVVDHVELRNFGGVYDIDGHELLDEDGNPIQVVAKGSKFTLVIEAHDAATGDAILNDGKPVTNIKTFVYEGQETEDIDVTFDATGLDGKTIVFYETLYFGEHTMDDLSDEDKVLVEDDRTLVEQSVYIPVIHTTATDKETNSKQLSLKRTLIDLITMEGILPNKTYTIETKVVDKATGKFLKDANGNVVVETTTWTSPDANVTDEITHPEINHSEYKCNDCDATFLLKDKVEEHLVAEQHSGYTNIIVVDQEEYVEEVTIDAVNTQTTVEINLSNVPDIEGKDIVVYEYMYLDGKLFAAHTDINDKDQTIEVPDAKTKAVSETGNENYVDGTNKEAKIIDTVKYSNLIVGQEYTVEGKLVVKPVAGKDGVTADENGNLIIPNDYKYSYVTDDDGNIITQKVTFIAEKSDGKIDVEFIIDATKYAGKKLVAFETVKIEDVDVAIHADINDNDQTLPVSLLLHVQIAKADRDNVKYFLKDAEITIYKKATEEGKEDTIAKDVNGNDCVALTDENGMVDFTVMYIDENDQFYAMETKAPRGYNICEDKFEIHPSGDRESAGTDLIKISILDAIIVIPPKTGGTSPVILLGILLGVGTLGIIILLVTRKKKDDDDKDSSDDQPKDENPDIVESNSNEEDSNETSTQDETTQQ